MLDECLNALQSKGGRGSFIVLEGLDRSGKSTQVAKLVESLEEHGLKAKAVRFPDRTTAIGQMIDAYLRQSTELDDHAIHLLFSANRWECAKAIERDLAAGIHVVADRYAFSGVAFSAAKGLDYEWCKSPDLDLLSPDLVLFLNLTPDVARQRGGFGEERYETEELQNKVRHVFEKLGKDVQDSCSFPWIIIDAGQTQEQVSVSILDAVTKQLSTGSLGQVKHDLWNNVKR